MSFNCKNFRAHQLRPDKCKDCFGDKSRHPTTEQENGAQQQQQQQQQSQQNQASPEVSSPAPKSPNPFKSPSSTTPNLHERLLSTPEPASTNNLTRDALVEELLKCRQDRASLQEREKKYQLEIDRLKAELSQVAGNRRPSVQLGCQQCEINSNELKRARNELESLQAELRSVKTERDQAREEQNTLEREMEELHDNFKEEESEQFEQLKQELDATMKNCKILQIRLNKCERQYGQLEQVKTMLERRVEELQASNNTSQQHTINSSTPPTTMQQVGCNSSNFVQLGADFVKLSAREYDQLLRDLNDTTERERDLQEQIKYSQEEAQLKSDKLQAVEAENEVLLGKINKLTLANSRLRSSPLRTSTEQTDDSSASATSGAQVASEVSARIDTSELIQQNEQLKLAVEIAQSESKRTKDRLGELKSSLDTRETQLRELETKFARAEAELARLKPTKGGAGEQQKSQSETRLELECRQLRARLVQSERDCKQLRSQLEMLTSRQESANAGGGAGRQSRALNLALTRSSQSMESTPGEQARNREINRQLEEQCSLLQAKNADLERRLKLIGWEQNVGETKMESDLLEKLKRQLDASESELAKAKSRLVEMDLECGRAQRQYKRLVNSLESNEFQYGRRVKLPPESSRDAMSRQELREFVRELELELEEFVGALKAKDCLLKEMALVRAEQPKLGSTSPTSTTSDEQLKSLRRLVDQERLLSNNLKVDVAALEHSKLELETRTRMLERERVAMEEELDKLRQVNVELNGQLEDARRSLAAASIKLKEFQINYEKVKTELNQLEVARASEESSKKARSAAGDSTPARGTPSRFSDNDLLLMTRDLSELKVKNGFLMRQLEIAREDAARQVEELRESSEAQQRRAVELAQIELKEKQLAEVQLLKDELSELKQRLAAAQRQVSKAEEEVASEKDRWRSMDRDWKRDKSQWQQKLEQLEAQRQIERRSNEFRVKEVESQVREKERELLAMQDRYVQMERDQKRLQNKYNILEEDSETKRKELTRELDGKKRELADMAAVSRTREEEYYSNCSRFNTERATLLEALESIKKSYDEKLVELSAARELINLRQENAFKERINAQDRIDNLTEQLIAAGEHETQVKLLRHQLSTLEKQLEATKRDYLQGKEERVRLKTRCGELEQRCAGYEKQELISKTSSISSATSSFLRSRSPFRSTGAKKASFSGESPAAKPCLDQHQTPSEDEANRSMMEQLTSKINDQRHLINLLKQQLAETQMELKQLKLLQSAERSKWQNRVAILTSRLNESEEKLAFETSLLSNRDTLLENARKRMEVKWAQERGSTLELLQQSQSQNEMLARDLKKVSQSYDLLRLQAKQLEANNGKLSRKLIEYQQQQQHLGFGGGGGSVSRKQVSEFEHQLESFRSEKNQLTSQRDQLERQNMRLLNIMRCETVPLVEIVNKILLALDEPAKKNSTDSGAPQSSAGTMSTPATPSSGFSSTSLLSRSTIDDRNSSSVGGASSSTARPLRIPLAGAGKPASQHDEGGPEEREEDDELSDVDGIPPVSTARPAHQVASEAGQSRLSRLLIGTKRANKQAANLSDASSSISTAAKPAATKAGVKRVRVKCASLGITATEKKRLRSHLQELNSALAALGQETSSRTGATVASRTGAGSAGKLGWDSSNLRPTTRRELRHSNDESDRSAGSRVHWQLDSDLDSSEPSWSVGRSASEQPARRPPAMVPQVSSNVYRRFPQASPSGYGASLTDYESESSLASDFLPAGYSNRVAISGVESDSAMQPASSGKASARKRTGLKSRLTSTLRNISRSITGLASDSESEQQVSKQRRPGKSWTKRVGDDDDEADNDAALGESTTSRLREIRV